MRAIQQFGPYADTMDAPSPNDPKITVKLGIRSDTYRTYGQRRMATAIAQYYGIVQDGMMAAQHLFRGLNRPLMLAANPNADKAVLVYTWRSLVDYEWEGSPYLGIPRLMIPPPGRVFVVIAREEEGSGIFGSIERWNWIREDPELPHAPVAWEQRYGQRLWSR